MTAIKEIRPTEQQIFNILPSTSTTNNSLSCDVCSKTFQNRSAKRLHMSKSHATSANNWIGLDQQLGVSAEHKSLLLKFLCPKETCVKKSFSSSKLLLQHFQKSHLEKRLCCPDCQSKFSLMRDLNYHAKKKCSVLKTHQIASSSTVRTAATGCIKNFKNSVETQTDEVSNAMKQFLLIPITKYRRILPKPLPTCTTSTQVETIESTEKWLLPPHYIENANYQNEPSNFVDIGLQADFTEKCFHKLSAQSDISDYYCSANISHQQKHQDSFSQTAYPQTVDFGTQYVSSNRALLELPPLKSATSTANALVGTDGTTTNTQFLSPMASNTASLSHYPDPNASKTNYWCHIETQTSGAQIYCIPHKQPQVHMNANPAMFAQEQDYTRSHSHIALDVGYNCVETQTAVQSGTSVLSANTQCQ